MTSLLPPDRRTPGRGLLSYGDQVRLARAVEAGREAEGRLAEAHRLPRDERRRLEEEADQGEEARRQLIEAHAPLVLTEAQRYTGGGRLTVVELVQQGNSGLVRAVDTFDWRQGERLSTYASRWIRLAIESERPDLPDPGLLRPDPVVLRLYRERVVSLDDGQDVAPPAAVLAPGPDPAAAAALDGTLRLATGARSGGRANRANGAPAHLARSSRGAVSRPR